MHALASLESQAITVADAVATSSHVNSCSQQQCGLARGLNEPLDHSGLCKQACILHSTSDTLLHVQLYNWQHTPYGPML